MCLLCDLLQVFEYVVDGSEECVRCEGVEGIASFVKDNQQYALVSHHLSRYTYVDYFSGELTQMQSCLQLILYIHIHTYPKCLQL